MEMIKSLVVLLSSKLIFQQEVNVVEGSLTLTLTNVALSLFESCLRYKAIDQESMSLPEGLDFQFLIEAAQLEDSRISLISLQCIQSILSNSQSSAFQMFISSHK